MMYFPWSVIFSNITKEANEQFLGITSPALTNLAELISLLSMCL
jgi:hypothetical protein